MNFKLLLACIVVASWCVSAKAVTTLWVHTAEGESIPFEIADI